ncbi:MAG: amidohydrolase [Oscillospiraceae bacterium]|jgi:5-methylthioadenosine/S-adenosylhomocysteine deaminase|nr:amidohydrolase [Oscillospiraceae bacterium]
MTFKNVQYITPDFTVKRGDVTVRDGKFALDALRAEDEVFDGENRLLIPGFVNAHCHVPMTLLRGWGGGLPLDRWLTEKVYPFEDKMTDDDIYWASLVGIAEMLASGCTRFHDFYAGCGAIAAAVETSGIRGNLARGLLNFGNGSLEGSQRLAESEALFALKSELVTPEVALHAEYTSDEGYVREVAQYAKSRRARVQVHISETRKEHEECKQRRSGRTPTEYLADCGLLDSPTIAAHCVHISERDRVILAERGVTVAHCPESNLKLNSGILPLHTMRGVKLALGTDGASSNNNLNMPEELHVAALLGQLSDAPLTAAELLAMAFGDNRITDGGSADFAVVRLDRPHMVPAHDVRENLVFSAQASDIEMTVVNGRIVCRDGRVSGFDLDAAMRHVSDSAHRIAAELT